MSLTATRAAWPKVIRTETMTVNHKSTASNKMTRGNGDWITGFQREKQDASATMNQGAEHQLTTSCYSSDGPSHATRGTRWLWDAPSKTKSQRSKHFSGKPGHSYDNQPPSPLEGHLHFISGFVGEPVRLCQAISQDAHDWECRSEFGLTDFLFYHSWVFLGDCLQLLVMKLKLGLKIKHENGLHQFLTAQMKHFRRLQSLSKTVCKTRAVARET